MIQNEKISRRGPCTFLHGGGQKFDWIYTTATSLCIYYFYSSAWVHAGSTHCKLLDLLLVHHLLVHVTHARIANTRTLTTKSVLASHIQ